MNAKPILFLSIACLLAGCASPTRPNLSVLIPNTTPEAVRNTAVKMLVDDRWTITRGDTLGVEAIKDLPFGAQIFVQELGAQPARHQVNLILLPEAGDVTLLGTLATITTRYGSPQRHQNNQQDAKLRFFLDRLRARVTGEPEPVFVAPPPMPRTESPKGAGR